MKLSFSHIPETWVAMAKPWTYVIMARDDGLGFAASAKNYSLLVMPKTKLGSAFQSLKDAQDACEAHYNRHRQ